MKPLNLRSTGSAGRLSCLEQILLRIRQELELVVDSDGGFFLGVGIELVG